MTKPMTISEAVEKALFRLSLHSDGEAMDICRTLDGKRLCDEAEAREVDYMRARADAIEKGE